MKAPPAPKWHFRTFWNTNAAFRRSLQVRLLFGTLLGICLALILAAVVLTSFFRSYATKQFQSSMQIHLNQLMASLELDAQGQPILVAPLSDPRFTQPLSGLYWQINAKNKTGLLRSRSLWDDVITLPDDAMSDSPLHFHKTAGPGGLALEVIERQIRMENYPDQSLRLLVAGSTTELEHSISDWTHRLILFFSILFITLTFVTIAQVMISLAPLRSLQKVLGMLRAGSLSRLKGDFPQEVQPLIDDFNSVLDHSAAVVARARAQTGDLAHALKTPLAVLTNAAARSYDKPDSSDELARLVREQVNTMQRHIDWRLQRARTAATSGMPLASTPIKPLLEQLLRVMKRVHADRALHYSSLCEPETLSFSGEAQDFQEMIGNLLDNASKWASAEVRVQALLRNGQLLITIDDDGPGLDSDQHGEVLQRGVRADEKTPGSGLGLAIVKDLVDLYDGHIDLAQSPQGGLRVILRF